MSTRGPLSQLFQTQGWEFTPKPKGFSWSWLVALEGGQRAEQEQQHVDDVWDSGTSQPGTALEPGPVWGCVRSSCCSSQPPCGNCSWNAETAKLSWHLTELKLSPHSLFKWKTNPWSISYKAAFDHCWPNDLSGLHLEKNWFESSFDLRHCSPILFPCTQLPLSQNSSLITPSK